MAFIAGLLAGGLLGAYWTRPGGWLSGIYGRPYPYYAYPAYPTYFLPYYTYPPRAYYSPVYYYPALWY